MNYYKLIKRADPAKTAIIEDGNVYTYGELSCLVSVMAEKILKEQEYKQYFKAACSISGMQCFWGSSNDSAI